MADGKLTLRVKVSAPLLSYFSPLGASVVGERLGFRKESRSSLGVGRQAEGFCRMIQSSWQAEGERLTIELDEQSELGALGQTPGSETIALLPVLTREAMRDHERDCLSRAQCKLDSSPRKL